MSTVWVVIDEGCQECGVESVPIGIFTTEAEAKAAVAARNAETKGWGGGQTLCAAYSMRLPSAARS